MGYIIGFIIGQFIVNIIQEIRYYKLKELEEKIDTLYYSTYAQTRITILEREIGLQKKDYYFRTHNIDSPEFGRKYIFVIYYGYGNSNEYYSTPELDKLYPEELIYSKTFEDTYYISEIFDKVFEEEVAKHKAIINE